MALELSFLWHMHQPSYEGRDGKLYMPWVFLHSIKDYYDMPWLLSLYPNLRATFNITPTLIEGIKVYEEFGYKRDIFLIAWIKEPKDLSQKERKNLLKICKSAQYETMVKPFDRFIELYTLEDYSSKELIELEVLFMLSWCGNYLRKDNQIVKELIKKQRGYTQSDKDKLLKELLEFIPTILRFYKELLNKDKIAISTTPYNHPILPLLIDMDNAIISNPKTLIPKEPLSLRDDAIKQIDRAIELYKETFGMMPMGFWPAEGAVDEKSLELYKQKGIKWVASDEEILFRSLKKRDKNLIYKRFEYDKLFIAFRDHSLSDKIGFSYRYMDEEESVAEFIRRVEDIGEGNVFVILDGENAWEFYKDNAFDFFNKLYKALSNSITIKTRTFDEVSKQNREKLPCLYPGSWIYGTFDTWVGHSEKNRAWELIYQTKRDISKVYDKLEDSKKELIDKHFLASECSDWFWWYGEDHYSSFLEDFDTLFRSHLIDIYKIAGINIPSVLLMPISKERRAKLSLIKPKFFLSPHINGRVDSFYEWLGCGIVDQSTFLSTMDGVKDMVKILYYAEDFDCFYFRFDVDVKSFLKNYKEIRVHIKEIKTDIILPVVKSYEKEGMKLACNEIVEFCVDKRYIGDKKSFHIQLQIINIMDDSEFVPLFGDLELSLDDYAKNWFI